MPFTRKTRIVGPYAQWLTMQAEYSSPGTGVGAVIEWLVPPATGIIGHLLTIRSGTGLDTDPVIATQSWAVGDPRPTYVRRTVGERPYATWDPITATGRRLPPLRSALAPATTAADAGIWASVPTTIPDGAITWVPMTGAGSYVTSGRRGVATVTTAWAAPPAGFVAEAVRVVAAPDVDPSPPTSLLSTFATLFPSLVPGTTPASWTSANGALAGPTPETSDRNCWAVYYRHVASGQRRLLRIYEFVAQADVITWPSTGIDAINQTATGADLNALWTDAIAKLQARITNNNPGKHVVGLPDGNYGVRSISLQGNPDQELVLRSVNDNVGDGRPGARLTQLTLDAVKNTSISFLNADRDGLGYSKNNISILGGQNVGVRYCNVELMHPVDGNYSSFYTTFANNGLLHYAGNGDTYGIEIRAKGSALPDGLRVENNAIRGPFQQGIGGALSNVTEKNLLRLNAHNDVKSDDYMFVQGSWVEEENWGSRDLHPAYSLKSNGTIDIDHSDFRQAQAQWSLGQLGYWLTFDGLVSRRCVSLLRSCLGGVTQVSRQGVFSSDGNQANALIEGAIIATNHVTGIGLSQNTPGASTGNIVRYNTLLAVIDYPRASTLGGGTWVYSVNGLNGPASVRNVFANSDPASDWMIDCLRLPVASHNWTRQDEYYTSARRASSFYDYRPVLASGCHYSDTDPKGAYATFERVIEDKIGFPKAGPARWLWEATYNAAGQIAA